MEVLNSQLSEFKKEFLLKEISILKYSDEMKPKELMLENAKVDFYDSQLEGDWMACMDGKISEAFESADTWLETVNLIYSLAAGGVIIMEIACLYEVWPDEE